MNSSERFACPCCGFRTLAEEPPGTYTLCPVCYWEDDLVQYRDPGFEGGANRCSLTQARANYALLGASAPEYLNSVRAPLPEELVAGPASGKSHAP